nr:NADPH:quinone oxidoreductase family protein [Sphingomonas sp. CDS-1]
MRALLSIEPGGPQTLELRELPTQKPGKGELRVRVLACGINFPDVLIIEDKYQFKPARPFAPGAEISAIVDAVGEGVTEWQEGDRLIAFNTHGGLSEEIVIPAEKAIHLPDGFDPVEAAALLLTYGTTIHALIDRAALQADETLLVLGAAGGVGLAAVEIGKVLGARVVAAVSTEEKATAAKDAGADEVLIYPGGPLDDSAKRDLAQSFKKAVGARGADVIFDPVGGTYAEPALRCAAWEGRYLVIGFPAGIPSIPLNLILLKSCDLRGVFWGAFTERNPARHRDHVSQLLSWWKNGQIRPHIDRIYSLEQGSEALERLASRSAIGKVVVRM